MRVCAGPSWLSIHDVHAISLRGLPPFLRVGSAVVLCAQSGSGQHTCCAGCAARAGVCLWKGADLAGAAPAQRPPIGRVITELALALSRGEYTSEFCRSVGLTA